MQVLGMARSRSMRSETTPCFGCLNVMSACESFVETVEAESLFVSSPSFNILPFSRVLASHENRLAMSKPGRFQKCAFWRPQPPRKLTGVKTNPKYHAAYSANCFFLTNMPRQVAAETVNRDQRRLLGYWGFSSDRMETLRKQNICFEKKREPPSDDRLAPKGEQH